MFNCFLFIGVLFTMVQSMFTLCLGRFMCGISAGVLNLCMSVSMSESVTTQISGQLGAMTNLYFCVGLLFANALGTILPQDPELYVADDNWRIIYGMPAIVAMIQIAIFLVHFTEEPILFSISKGNDASAVIQIAKLFTVPGAKNEEDKNRAYQAHIDFVRANSNKSSSVVSFRDALCHPEYRRATWVCFALAVFNRQTGMSSINVYLTTLYQKVIDMDPEFPMTANRMSTITQVCNVAACIISIFTLNAFGRKTILIFGQTSMIICQVLGGVFYQLEMPTGLFCCILLFISCWSLTQGSVIWTYLAEVTIDKAIGVCVLGLWSSSFEQVVTIQALITAMGL